MDVVRVRMIGTKVLVPMGEGIGPEFSCVIEVNDAMDDATRGHITENRIKGSLGNKIAFEF